MSEKYIQKIEIHKESMKPDSMVYRCASEIERGKHILIFRGDTVNAYKLTKKRLDILKNHPRYMIGTGYTKNINTILLSKVKPAKIAKKRV